MNELLKYDFKSAKKGRGMSSILIRDMNKKRVGQAPTNATEKQQQNGDNNILTQPPGVMNVKKWYDKLTPA